MSKNKEIYQIKKGTEEWNFEQKILELVGEMQIDFHNKGEFNSDEYYKRLEQLHSETYAIRKKYRDKFRSWISDLRDDIVNGNEPNINMISGDDNLSIESDNNNNNNNNKDIKKYTKKINRINGLPKIVSGMSWYNDFIKGKTPLFKVENRLLEVISFGKILNNNPGLKELLAGMSWWKEFITGEDPYGVKFKLEESIKINRLLNDNPGLKELLAGMSWRKKFLTGEDLYGVKFKLEESVEVNRLLNDNPGLKELLARMSWWKRFLNGEEAPHRIKFNLQRLIKINKLLNDNPNLIEIIQNMSWRKKFLAGEEDPLITRNYISSLIEMLKRKNIDELGLILDGRTIELSKEKKGKYQELLEIYPKYFDKEQMIVKGKYLYTKPKMSEFLSGDVSPFYISEILDILEP